MGHLAGEPHLAVDVVAAKYKFYFVLNNQTGRDLSVLWKVDTNGHRGGPPVAVAKTRAGLRQIERR